LWGNHVSVQDSVLLKKIIKLAFLAKLGQWPCMRGDCIAKTGSQNYLKCTQVHYQSGSSSYSRESSELEREFSKKHGIFWISYQIISMALFRIPTELRPWLLGFFQIISTQNSSQAHEDQSIDWFKTKFKEFSLPFHFPGYSWAHTGCPAWSHWYIHTCLQKQEKEAHTPLVCNCLAPKFHLLGTVSSKTCW
jgi:hypothetical protein